MDCKELRRNRMWRFIWKVQPANRLIWKPFRSICLMYRARFLVVLWVRSLDGIECGVLSGKSSQQIGLSGNHLGVPA